MLNFYDYIQTLFKSPADYQAYLQGKPMKIEKTPSDKLTLDVEAWEKLKKQSAEPSTP